MRARSLLHNCALEHDKHEQCKQDAVPVFVEAPHHDTEDLENEGGRSGMVYSAPNAVIGVLNIFSP